VATNIRGYALPENYAPADFVCVKAYIPNDPEYLREFWGAYGYFTQWSAFKRDPLHKGKAAAIAWRNGYDKAREEYILRGGCPVSIENIRQNPLNPCSLEFSEDGVTWTEFADLSKCGNGCGGSDGVLQFDGQTVNQWDDCLQQWTPLAPAFNPSTQGTYSSVYESGLNGECNGAANITAWLASMAKSQLSAMATGATIGQIGTLVVQSLMITVGIPAFLTAVIDALLAEFSEDEAVLTDAADLDITEEFRNILVLYMSSDGTIKEPQFTQAVTALYARRDTEAANTAERVKWGHMSNLLSLAGPYVSSRNNKWANITDADCGDAGWIKVFDFSTGPLDFQRVQSLGVYLGSYVANTGWQPTAVENVSGKFTVGFPQHGATPATITSVEVLYDATLGTIAAGQHAALRLWDFPFHDGDTAVDDYTIITGDGQTHSFAVADTMSGVGVELFVGADILANPAPGGSGVIRKITIRGTGLNPYL
jgi:hypothetical protein